MCSTLWADTVTGWRLVLEQKGPIRAGITASSSLIQLQHLGYRAAAGQQQAQPNPRRVRVNGGTQLAGPGPVRSHGPRSALTVTVFVSVSADKERMETAGGPELHRPALVPALHRLLRRHGNHRQTIIPPIEYSRDQYRYCNTAVIQQSQPDRCCLQSTVVL